MMSDFDGPGVDPRFRQLLSKAKPVKWGFFHHLRTASYFRDRVALVGDSAHASLPFQAAGAAQGLEDALLLSTVLAELAKRPERGSSQLPLVHAALSAYDSVRRPRAQKQLEGANEVGDMMFFQHEEAGDDMAKILPRLQQGRFNWLWFHDMQDDVNEVLSRMHKLIKGSAYTGKI
jgi:2-polyprenyl-6-methoxyphenol hydroxylase-like FAD-dependent oxidoreductase